VRMYAVILAGGSGKRLWPLSRQARPKQLVDITFLDKPLLQETFARLAPLMPPDDIYVVTGERYMESTSRELPSVPPSNIIREPEGRGSAPAIGLAAVHLWYRDSEAVMVCLPADHYIAEPERFRDVLLAAEQVAQDGHLVTLGIRPEYPHTGYGYIEIGEELTEVGEFSAHSVRHFTEKPDEQMARLFVEGGRHFWNSGMFIWKASAILHEIERHLPRLHECLREVGGALGTPDGPAVLERTWPGVERETIDFGVMEKANDVVVIPVDMGWSDIGSWASLADLLPADGDGNIVVGQHLGLGTKGCVIYSPRRLVATVGVENLVVVETEDAILICARDRAEDVKELVDRLDEEGWQDWL
jgi:mannose-1-phosphate guanylyltransferase